MKTLLIGNFGAKNLGDELILNAALEKYPNSIVMTNDPEFSQTFCERKFETIGFFPTGFRSLWKYFKNRKSHSELKDEIEQVVFPGGGLFAIKFRAVWIWYMIFWWTRFKFRGKPIIFECQGVDQNLGGVSKFMVRSVFKRAKSVSVRDPESAEVLNYLVIKNVKIEEDAVAKFMKTQKWGAGGKSKLVLINALSKVNEKKWHKIIDKYDGYRRIFIAFQNKDERRMPKELEREFVFPTCKTELFTLFEKAEVVIGERFHVLVLGEYFCGAKHTYMLKAPYSEKVANFVKMKGIQVWKGKERVIKKRVTKKKEKGKKGTK